MSIVTDEILESYSLMLGARLRTGTDKITPTNFNLHKLDNYKVIKKKVQDGTYKFTRLKKIKLSNKRTVCIPTIRDRLTMEILKDNIKRKYKVRYNHRDIIIKTIIGKLNSGTPFHVIRLDVESFFSSISHSKLLHKLRNTSLLSYSEYELIKRILKLSEGNKGVPQGLSVSSILAEIFMESFDGELKRLHPRINYYCRYVDDIVIFINGHLTKAEETDLRVRLGEVFKNHRLKSNIKKEQIIKFTSKAKVGFDYLGYNFCYEDQKLKISISESKVKKIKETIDAYFNNFQQVHKNARLLLEQIKYITNKKSIYKNGRFLDKRGDLTYYNRKIYYGVIESYKEVGSESELWSYFDKYIKGKLLICRKKNLLAGGKILRELHSFSFKRNFAQNNIYKLNKLKKAELILLLMDLDKSLVRSRLSRENRIQLFGRYFKLVDF
ncbi:antiviral reverse transcriptase Drt3a [Paenibacillus lautus]|uniref:antiviral reverse transcriptase Drt3a n=1 Tax=Paenibacillus lautus TaxID=1401 RepID=UPI003D295139